MKPCTYYCCKDDPWHEDESQRCDKCGRWPCAHDSRYGYCFYPQKEEVTE